MTKDHPEGYSSHSLRHQSPAACRPPPFAWAGIIHHTSGQPMSSIDEIKARLDIVDLVSETVQLRRSGKNYTGFCPFHSNTRTPAFVVFPETGTWRCFGQCNEGGDIFGFVMKKEGWDFTEALRFLAEKAGVQLKPPTPAGTGRGRRARRSARPAGRGGHLLPPPAAQYPRRAAGPGLSAPSAA